MVFKKDLVCFFIIINESIKLDISPSLSFTHTHTHTHIYVCVSVCVREIVDDNMYMLPYSRRVELSSE